MTRTVRGDHGSHVASIAAANAYIPQGDGSFSSALESVLMQGVAPDAQILTMKVFGARAAPTTLTIWQPWKTPSSWAVTL